MPIKSYLVHPHEGRKGELVTALSSMSECEVLPAENKEVIVLVTDTDTKIAEDLLKERLDTLESIKLLAMVSGFDAPKK